MGEKGLAEFAECTAGICEFHHEFCVHDTPHDDENESVVRKEIERSAEAMVKKFSSLLHLNSVWINCGIVSSALKSDDRSWCIRVI